MDRRQRKTREAIFSAFIALLSKNDFTQITVRQIIEQSDISRATFYAHFKSKDFLLKELCEELFGHIFDTPKDKDSGYKYIFDDYDAPDSMYLHLFWHLQKNDNNILKLLSSSNNELFLRYFKEGFQKIAVGQLFVFDARKSEKLPEDFWIDHIASTFLETVRWWVANGMQESPETITEYFLLSV